ncbi:MAG: ACDE family multidrug resistance protein [Candidatus Poriferisodalaceae bacterium]
MFPRRAQPFWQLEFTGAKSIARLGSMEGLARSITVSTVPLIAFDALGSKRAVSLTYLAGAAMALTFTLNVATFERIMMRKWITTMGLVFLIASGLLFMIVDGPLFAVAVGFQSTATALFSVSLSLYTMDYIAKKDLVRAESTRMVYNGGAWLIGPTAGIWLWETGGRVAPFILSCFMAAAALAYFWALRLGNNPVLEPRKTAATSPLKNIPRFFKQKHLRIAYAITTVRALFWVAIFIYGPLYVVEAGLPTWASGVFLSSVASLLFFSPLVGRISTRHGTRAIVIVAFGIIGLGMVALAALGSPRPIGLACWIGAAVGASWLDVVGNVPFMRTVKPRERVPMTTVFATWREASYLITPGLAALVLSFAPFWVFYLCLAALSFLTATAATYLPRRL